MLRHVLHFVQHLLPLGPNGSERGHSSELQSADVDEWRSDEVSVLTKLRNTGLTGHGVLGVTRMQPTPELRNTGLTRHGVLGVTRMQHTPERLNATFASGRTLEVKLA